MDGDVLTRSEVDAAARGALRIANAVDDKQKAMAAFYHGVYACGYSGRGTLEPIHLMASALPDSLFVASVLARSRKNSVHTTDWQVAGISGCTIFLEGDGVRASWQMPTGSGVLPRIGATVPVSIPAVLSGVSPGFLWARGDARPPTDKMSRLYLNITSRYASWVMTELTARLNEAGIPYDVKVLAHPRSYRRRDACVLYVASEDVMAAVEIVARELRLKRKTLNESTPLFTRRLMPGVGYADEPSDLSREGLSHGLWVSGLFAEAVEHYSTVSAVVQRVRQLVEADGRDPDRPYLRQPPRL